MAKKVIKKVKKVVKKTVVDDYNVHLMVDFTAMQLKLCYDKLVMYPEVQQKIVKLISELSKI